MRRIDGVEGSPSPSRPREHAATLASTPPPRPSHFIRAQERVLELPGLVGGEAGEKRLALNLPPPDLEEDTLMEKDEAPEDVLELSLIHI